MKQMNVAMVTQPYTVEIRRRDIPSVGRGDVCIRTTAAGICGSDLHLFKGTHPFRHPPAVLGHEIVGEIVEVGSDVTGLHEGDRVTVLPHIPCGECAFCRAGHQNLCLHKKVPGTDEWCGTFAEYFVAPERCVYPIAPDVSDEVGALAEPLAVAVHAINRICVPAKSIAILGTGTIGLLCAIVARERGFERVYCTDTSAFNLEMARRYGATLAVNPLEAGAEEAILADNGGRVDVVIVAASAPTIIDQASRLCNRLGQIVLIAMITRQIPVYTYGIVFNEQILSGAMTYRDEDFAQAVEMINNGLDLSACVTQRLAFDETEKGLTMLDQKTADIVKILVYPQLSSQTRDDAATQRYRHD